MGIGREHAVVKGFTNATLYFGVLAFAPDSTVGKAPAAPLGGTMNEMNEKKTLAGADDQGPAEGTLARIRPAFRKQLRSYTKDRDRSVESTPVRKFRDGQLDSRRPVDRPVDRNRPKTVAGACLAAATGPRVA